MTLSRFFEFSKEMSPISPIIEFGNASFFGANVFTFLSGLSFIIMIHDTPWQLREVAECDLSVMAVCKESFIFIDKRAEDHEEFVS
jgi:hypothetical protein